MSFIFDILLSLLRSYMNFLTGDPILGIICTIGIVIVGWWLLDQL